MINRIEPINRGKERLHEANELGKEDIDEWTDWINASDISKVEEK